MKPVWNGEFAIDLDQEKAEMDFEWMDGNHELLDMTMVSVFYDAGINELRKVATRKAVGFWMK